MTHDKLLVKLMVMDADESEQTRLSKTTQALRAVVELHSDNYGQCFYCADLNYSKEGLNDQDTSYPCPTIQAIEKELG